MLHYRGEKSLNLPYFEGSCGGLPHNYDTILIEKTIEETVMVRVVQGIEGV